MLTKVKKSLLRLTLFLYSGHMNTHTQIDINDVVSIYSFAFSNHL